MTEKVAVFTESGLMARRLSSIRSGLQTFGLTTCPDVCNQLALIWGVQPFHHRGVRTNGAVAESGDPGTDPTAELLKIGEKILLDAGVVDAGETLIMMAGRLSGYGLSSSVVVWTIGENIPRR
jgi:pyruvate kinase